MYKTSKKALAIGNTIPPSADGS